MEFNKSNYNEIVKSAIYKDSDYDEIFNNQPTRNTILVCGREHIKTLPLMFCVIRAYQIGGYVLDGEEENILIQFAKHD